VILYTSQIEPIFVSFKDTAQLLSLDGDVGMNFEDLSEREEKQMSCFVKKKNNSFKCVLFFVSSKLLRYEEAIIIYKDGNKREDFDWLFLVGEGLLCHLY